MDLPSLNLPPTGKAAGSLAPSAPKAWDAKGGGRSFAACMDEAASPVADEQEPQEPQPNQPVRQRSAKPPEEPDLEQVTEPKPEPEPESVPAPVETPSETPEAPVVAPLPEQKTMAAWAALLNPVQVVAASQTQLETAPAATAPQAAIPAQSVTTTAIEPQAVAAGTPATLQTAFDVEVGAAPKVEDCLSAGGDASLQTADSTVDTVIQATSPQGRESRHKDSSGNKEQQPFSDEPPFAYKESVAPPAPLLDEHLVHSLSATARGGPMAPQREAATPALTRTTAVAPQETTSSGPVKSMNLHFDAPNGKAVVVRVSEAAGGVRIGVHTDDERLAQAYRVNLRELSDQFDRKGIQAFTRSSESAEPVSASAMSAKAEEQPRDPNHQGQQQQQQREQSQQQWRRWRPGAENFSLAGLGEDF